jgi:hypothetical protein
MSDGLFVRIIIVEEKISNRFYRSTFGDDGKVNPAQKRIQVSDTRSGEIKILDSGSSSQIHLWSQSKIENRKSKIENRLTVLYSGIRKAGAVHNFIHYI